MVISGSKFRFQLQSKNRNQAPIHVIKLHVSGPTATNQSHAPRNNSHIGNNGRVVVSLRKAVAIVGTPPVLVRILPKKRKWRIPSRATRRLWRVGQNPQSSPVNDVTSTECATCDNKACRGGTPRTRSCRRRRYRWGSSSPGQVQARSLL
jgi:hypothetical protein